MKNHLIISMMFLSLLTSGAFSQESKLRLGIIGGISVSNLSYNFDGKSDFLDTSFSNTPKVHISIGTFLLYDFVKNFGLKFQGQYTIKGGVTDATMSYNSVIGYIQLSLLPQYNLPIKGDYDNRFYFNAGGYLALNTGAHEDVTFGSYEETRKLDNSLKGNDAGLMFGIGIIAEKFILDISYSHGLTNIVEDQDNAGFLSIKNRSLNFSIGFNGRIMK